MSWLSRLNPLGWLRRSITVELLQSLGLYAPPAAGITLTPEVALGVSAVYCADRVISEDLASLPMVMYSGHRLDDGAKMLPFDPVSRLLARPNPEQTAPVFWSAFQHDCNFWGYGVAEIAYDGAGRAKELWHLPARTVRIERWGGRLRYHHTDPDTGHQTTLSHDEVLVVPGFSPDGTIGFRLLQLARLTLGSAAAIQEFTAARFKNGFRPSGAIKVAGILSDSARENMRKSWHALYGGATNAGVPILLEEGAAWDKFDIAHNDQLQLAELGELLVDEVARFFNVSPVKLHKLGRATWGNLGELNRDHVITTLGPWISKRDAEVDAKLGRPGVHCRHVVDRLLTADTRTRIETWNSAVNAGWMTFNEARAREDLPPKEGGDDLRLPLNQAPAANPEPGTRDPGPDPKPAPDPKPDPKPEAPVDGTRTDPPQPAG